MGGNPTPYTLANERTYLSWLRLAVTLLAGAVAIDRLFIEHPGWPPKSSPSVLWFSPSAPAESASVAGGSPNVRCASDGRCPASAPRFAIAAIVPGSTGDHRPRPDPVGPMVDGHAEGMGGRSTRSSATNCSAR